MKKSKKLLITFLIMCTMSCFIGCGKKTSKDLSTSKVSIKASEEEAELDLKKDAQNCEELEQALNRLSSCAFKSEGVERATKTVSSTLKKNDTVAIFYMLAVYNETIRNNVYAQDPELDSSTKTNPRIDGQNWCLWNIVDYIKVETEDKKQLEAKLINSLIDLGDNLDVDENELEVLGVIINWGDKNNQYTIGDLDNTGHWSVGARGCFPELIDGSLDIACRHYIGDLREHYFYDQPDILLWWQLGDERINCYEGNAFDLASMNAILDEAANIKKVGTDSLADYADFLDNHARIKGYKE